MTPEENYDPIQRLINNKADYVYVNSWHLNEEESMAMWRLYSPNHGIAIRSTFERLHSALQDAESEISAGMIAYEDMTAPPPNVSDPLSYAFRKHAAYRDEHEMRLAVVETPTMGVAFDPHPVSIRIRVDVDALIDQVVVAPGAPAYLLAAVRTVMNHWLPEIHPLPSNLLTPLAY